MIFPRQIYNSGCSAERALAGYFKLNIIVVWFLRVFDICLLLCCVGWRKQTVKSAINAYASLLLKILQRDDNARDEEQFSVAVL